MKLMSINVFLGLSFNRLRLKYFAVSLMLVMVQACGDNKNHELGIKQNKLSPSNIRFSINQQDIELLNGYAQQSAAPDSSNKIITQVLREPTLADLNADGLKTPYSLWVRMVSAVEFFIISRWLCLMVIITRAVRRFCWVIVFNPKVLKSLKIELPCSFWSD